MEIMARLGAHNQEGSLLYLLLREFLRKSAALWVIKLDTLFVLRIVSLRVQ